MSARADHVAELIGKCYVALDALALALAKQEEVVPKGEDSPQRNDWYMLDVILNQLANDDPAGLSWPGVARLVRRQLAVLAASEKRANEWKALATDGSKSKAEAEVSDLRAQIARLQAEPSNEEMVPHAFKAKVGSFADTEGPIWCAHCEYHRDFEIHRVPPPQEAEK